MTSLKNKINFNKIRNKGSKIKAKLKADKEERENKKVKKVKKEKKVKNSRVGYYILIAITALAILFFLAVIAFGAYIILKAPAFDPHKLYEKEASIIYFSNGEIMATLGTSVGNDTVEKREKVTYDELSQVFIDALIATEDSRFFQHNGFDLFRFLKASVGQLMGNSDAGGASTLTMQVVKNTWTDTTSTGIEGIIRKFTDIYMAVFKVEKNYTKNEIIEFYVNGPFLGSGAYGVEQASQVYFGKSVGDLSLPEAAMIAGLFQAPTAYDPYVYPDNADARKNVVLNLMLRHGYITEEECETAKSIHIKDLLVNSTASTVSEYQGAVDTIVKEIINNYDVSPYDVSMEIYSTIIKEKQDVINKFYNEELGYEFKDEKIQVGISMLDNDTGAMIAVGAGRNKDRALGFNYATEIDSHPGSTAKPIFEYGPGIEYLKWSTYTPFFDENDVAYSSGQVISNWNNQYEGLVTLKYALYKSKNTVALQAFQAIDNNLKYDFVTSLGITPETTDGYLHEAHAVGAFNGVTPTELAGAYSAFANGGYFTKPYTVTKIVYRDTGEVVEPKHKREKVMSPQTAYMITNILFNVTPSSVRVSGTQVATKTGTSSYDDEALKEYGVPSSTIRDSWVATYSPDYTLSFWYGYDELYSEYYNTMSSSTSNRNKIQGVLLNNLFEKSSKFTNPGGISSVKVELETIPAQLASEYTPEDLVETHLFIKGTEPSEVSPRFAKLSDPTDLNVIETSSGATLTWTSPGVPEVSTEEYLKNYFNTNYGKYADKYYNLRLQYNTNYMGDFGFDIYLKNGETLKYIGFTTDTTYTISNTNGYNEVVVKSAYSKFKNNASNGISKTVTGSATEVDIELLALEDSGKIHPTIAIGGTIPDAGIDTIKIIVNGLDITETIDKSTITMTIKNRVTNETLNSLSEIDTSQKGWYQITYHVIYLGVTYSSEGRSIYIE